MAPLRAAGCAGLLALALGPTAAVDDVARLAPGAALGAPVRFGVNLGGRTAWGAEQLMANVLRNPGLEAVLDGALVVAGQVSARGVVDDTVWTARPAGFWSGARFEVLTGAAAGARGRVADDRRSAADQPVEFALEPLPQGLAAGDVIALQRLQDTTPAPLWWTEGDVRARDDDPRPGSPGTRSIELAARPGRSACLHHHLDGITARAGRLLPVHGRWRLSLWLRAPQPGARVRLRFARHGAAAFVDRIVEPSPQWRELVVDFEADDRGPDGPLQLTLEAERGSVRVDDVTLGSADDVGPGGFRREVVQALRELRPGVLRDWQGQLADTPANRAAEPWARAPVRYRPGEHEIQHPYSIQELGELAAAVGARPWITLPATTTPAQAREFGLALRRLWQRHGFEEIVVEHGNEHWNPTFRPAGIADPARLAQAAGRVLAALREGAGPRVPLHLVLGAPPAQPAAAHSLARTVPQVDGIAVAPYLLYRLEAGTPPAAALQSALNEDADALRDASGLLRRLGRSLDVYEVNLHTTFGSAVGAERDRVVTAPAAGVALARRLLQATLAGVQRQAVYALAGYDTFAHDGQLVQLFGIARDLAGPLTRWRATGQAVVLLNEVAGGPAWAGACRGPRCDDLVVVAWAGAAGTRWSGVNSSQRAATLQWACAGTQRLRWIDGSGARAVDAGAVAVVDTAPVPCHEGQARFTVPGASLWVAQPAR